MQAVLLHNPAAIPSTPSPPWTRPFPTATSASIRRLRTPVARSAHRATADITVDASDSPAAAFSDYQFLFASQRSEAPHPLRLRLVEGSIPAEFPRGTYYLVGPGLFTDDHGSTVHPFDGHGYLRAFEFGEEGEVLYAARYVETAALREEREEGKGEWRFTHRGLFSLLRGGRRFGNFKVLKNVANTTVVKWGGRLMCLYEGGDPYELHPGSLDTMGTVDLVTDKDRTAGSWWRAMGGVGALVGIGAEMVAGFLKTRLYGLLGKRLLSHCKIDQQRNRLLVLSCNMGDMFLPRSNFTFYEFDCDFNLKQKKEFVIPDKLIIHDWAFTENHYIIVGNRVKLDIPGSMLAVSGLSPMISALSVNPSQPTSPIYVLPRFSEDGTGGQRDWKVPIEAPLQLWVVHVSNAFEERDGEGGLEIQMHASVCSYQWFNFQKMFGYNWQSGRLDPSFMNTMEGEEALLPHLVQVSIELDAKGTHRNCSVANPSERWNRPADFPVINPAFSGRRSTYTYAGTTSGSRRFLPHFPFDTVVKLNCSDGSVATWSARGRRFVGEPLYVGRGEEEDDGYILVVEYAVAEQRCYLVVLDARRMGGPNALVAKLEVPKHLNFPLGFHGYWAAR